MYSLLVSEIVLHTLFSSSWLTLLLSSLGLSRYAMQLTRPDSSLVPCLAKSCNAQQCWKVVLVLLPLD